MFRTYCGGEYGFVSSHAANVFSLAIFLTLRYRKSLASSTHKRKNACLFPILIFLWAAIVGYSRPYLGKHYPGDVICGAMLGLAIGTLVHLITQFIDKLSHNLSERKKVA